MKKKNWLLGKGDWGLGIDPNPKSPINNPQSPIPNPQSPFNLFIFHFFYITKIIYFSFNKKMLNLSTKEFDLNALFSLCC